MLADKLDHAFRDLKFIYVYLEAMMISLIALWFFGIEENPRLGVIVVLLGTIALWTLIYIRFKTYKQALRRYHYKIVSFEHKLNYPCSFIKKLPHLSLGMGWVYHIGQRQFPKKYVKFEEGHRAYPIKEIVNIHQINLFKVNAMHPKYGALIEDIHHNKYLIDVRNLEMIS